MSGQVLVSSEICFKTPPYPRTARPTHDASSTPRPPAACHSLALATRVSLKSKILRPVVVIALLVGRHHPGERRVGQHRLPPLCLLLVLGEVPGWNAAVLADRLLGSPDVADVDRRKPAPKPAVDRVDVEDGKLGARSEALLDGEIDRALGDNVQVRAARLELTPPFPRLLRLAARGALCGLGDEEGSLLKVGGVRRGGAKQISAWWAGAGGAWWNSIKFRSSLSE